MSNKDHGISRRTILGCGAAALAAAGFNPANVQAQGKIPPEQLMYVAKTKTPGRFCANCLQFLGTHVKDYSELDEANPEMAECKIVAGKVAATGWCGVWSPMG
ncbi:high-potential iron-sulfur protein [Acuticoccus kandeliae]|uniref:high-potential iron-sulfur protein n=1 Tax=Acuticoccus kandeliae TaxID=2073160 RepID=UPI000D3E2BE5|nr:high-potential iron-sulfur protein [Acuticoccus kandeliae]